MDENNGKKDDTKSPSINWHSAFLEAIQLELQEYKDVLEFLHEFPLTSEPLRIDCVVIKKAKDTIIEKNIAKIFRRVNLLEYKSPDDHILVRNFYKVYAYACLYFFNEKTPITDMTITFVASSYPKELIKHLEEDRGNTVEETDSGIYNIKGDVFPIQIVDNRKLPPEENLWLRSLSNQLDFSAYLQIDKAARQLVKDSKVQAYLYAIYNANKKIIQEETKMENFETPLELLLKEVGYADKWKAEAEAEAEAKAEAMAEAKTKTKLEEQALSIAKNMLNLGFPFEAVVSATGLDPEKVKTLF
jgi:hypothetical protein